MTLAVVQVGEESNPTTANTAFTVDFPVATTSGNLILMCMAWVRTTGVTTNATSSGTGFTVDVEELNSGSSGAIIDGASILSRTSTGQTQFSLALSASRKCIVWGIEISGQAASPIDKVNGTEYLSAVSSMTPGSTGTLAQANEIGVCCAAWGNDGLGPDSWSAGWTEFGPLVEFAGAGADVANGSAYNIVSSTAALNPTHTMTGSDDGICVIATYKDVDTGGGPSGRIMCSSVGPGGLAYLGGIAGDGGGLAG